MNGLFTADKLEPIQEVARVEEQVTSQNYVAIPFLLDQYITSAIKTPFGQLSESEERRRKEGEKGKRTQIINDTYLKQSSSSTYYSHVTALYEPLSHAS